MPLPEVILNSALLSLVALGESSGATEGTSNSRVLDADDADVLNAGNSTRADHTLGHLDGEREVHVGGSRQAADAETWHVLGDFGFLEGGDFSAAGGGVDAGGQRASSIYKEEELVRLWLFRFGLGSLATELPMGCFYSRVMC